MTTLKNLIDTLGPVKKAERTPTSRKLREEAGEPIITTDSILVYPSGYAVYENESGRTVMWVPGCTSFTYNFDRLTDAEQIYQDQQDTLPEGMLEDLPWEMVLTLIGDHRIEMNSLNRAGSRTSRADFQSQDDGDKDGDVEDAIEESYRRGFIWRGDHIGEDPETIYIRNETREETLARMTDKQREAFLLYYEEGYNQREVAGILRISRDSVMDRLEGALQKVKRSANGILT
jgi:RNA polymerase sigma factor (sigma-70 family)